jgi:hypothetical protein
MKKGESISMSVIIIAAIALLVLVVLAVLVLRTGGGLQSGTGCEGVGGRCSEDQGGFSPCGDGASQSIANRGKLGGCTAEQICCVPVDRTPAEE